MKVEPVRQNDCATYVGGTRMHVEKKSSLPDLEATRAAADS